MKKHMIALLMALMLLMAALPMQAMADPYIELNGSVCTPAIQQGGTVKLSVHLWPEYLNNRIVVDIAGNSGFIKTVTKYVTNKNYDDKDVEINIDTSSMNLSSGTYIARIKVDYYNQGWWSTSDPALTHSFKVVSNRCGDNHKLVKLKTIKAATCEEAGVDQYKCSVCGYLANKDVAKLGHKYTFNYYNSVPTPEYAGEAVYSCVCGKFEVRELPISCAVKITTQPASVKVSVGDKATFSVKATGDGLTYQWYQRKKGASSWKMISCTRNTYSIMATSALDERQFMCEVTDKYGNVEESKVVALRLPPLKITAHPKDTWAYNGYKATVTAKATGDKVKYQWQASLDGGNTWKNTSCTTATYSLQMNAERDGRLVRCKITDAYTGTGASESHDPQYTNVAELTTRFKATIHTQPKNIKADKNQKVTFTIKASGDELTYQWYYANPDSSSFKKATSTEKNFSMTASDTINGRKVYCEIKDKYGNKVKSKVVSVTLKTELKITEQPTNQTRKPGQSIKLKVKAQGDNLKYKWYYRAAGSKKWVGTGCTTSSYNVKASDKYHGRRYYCLITDAYGNQIKTKEALIKIIK